MEFAGGKRSAIVIGGKGSSLSSADVYAVARGLRKATIESAALERLSHSQSVPHAPIQSSSNLLATIEVRAALVVLLNKLVISNASIRPIFPLLVEEILGLPLRPNSLDFGSLVTMFKSLYKLDKKHPNGDGGTTKDENGLMEKSTVTSIGICALLDCCASTLVKLSDAIAAFSCEAARVDLAVFDLPPSEDGFSIKDEADVAADIKAFLFRSRIVGQLKAESFSGIPFVHGSFRGAVRLLHEKTLLKLNSSISVRNNAVGDASYWKEKTLDDLVFSLALSIHSMCEISLGRTLAVATSLGNEEKRIKFMEEFEKRCPSLDAMSEGLCFASEKVDSRSDSAAVFHDVYELLVKLREILAWEAIVSFYALELDDSIEKPEADSLASIRQNGKNVKFEKNGEKKKKKKTLGSGTSVLWKIFKDWLSSQNDAPIDNAANFANRAQLFTLYFDPKNAGLDTLLGKIKEIVDRNKVPKVPKVIRAKGIQVLVSILGGDFLVGAELLFKLWGARVSTDFTLNIRARDNIDRAIDEGIPWVVIVGEPGVSTGTVKLKDIEYRQEEIILRETFLEEIQKRSWLESLVAVAETMNHSGSFFYL